MPAAARVRQKRGIRDAMKFETLTIDAVKSITQRNLLWQWNELARGRRCPAFADFHLDARLHDPKQLMFWSIEHGTGGRKFRARYHGARLNEVFRGDFVGKTMDEAVPKYVRQYALDTANECADSGCAVFSIISTIDPAGHRIDCERLLLPFGSSDEVQHLIASMQLISPKGDFRRNTVLDNYRITAKIEVAGRIRAGFARPKVTTPGLVVELDGDGASVQTHVAQRLAESSTRSTICGASPR